MRINVRGIHTKTAVAFDKVARGDVFVYFDDISDKDIILIKLNNNYTNDVHCNSIRADDGSPFQVDRHERVFIQENSELVINDY